MNSRAGAARIHNRRFPAWRPTARAAASIIATAALALTAAACGGSSRSQVAQIGSTSTQSSAASSTSAPSAQGHRALAYSRCMRSNAVLGYPDPNSSGGTDKSKITAARSSVGSSKFDAALNACRHLLPPSQPAPTPAEVQQVMRAMASVARCIRSHGVSNWPDPYLDAGRPTFDIHNIDYKPPRISAAIHDCQHLMPGSTMLRMCSSLVGTPGNEGCFEGG